ncbi:nuclear transport factor 2 family protein [Roseivirga misakiensis]|uniref:DUF4440 domain-containing protein n=1 Tax=Roseivirga misakiensis TaxID=1563681 RepID=A0A1E5SL09_9BACT|nr:nuclear transport factor 2 family protein [Roseivirga misakiensis]OEJ99818.1 hypothetical protein BFP71_09700 [Roseivirga misakiensis]
MFKNSQFFKSSKLLAFIIYLFYSVAAYGQSEDKLVLAIRENDHQFWQAYNSCDISKMISFLTEDLEFYHDKSGLTQGLSNFKKSLESNLCGNGAYLERTPVKESIAIYPLGKSRAIISGAHNFSIEGKMVESAKFTHVWVFENNQWKMSRVLSFDHQTVQFKSANTAIFLSEEALQSFVGEFQAPQTGKVTFGKSEGKLKMNAGPMELLLSPMKSNMFFHEQSSLTFEFLENGKKVVIRENGKVVEEAIRSN